MGRKNALLSTYKLLEVLERESDIRSCGDNLKGLSGLHIQFIFTPTGNAGLSLYDLKPGVEVGRLTFKQTIPCSSLLLLSYKLFSLNCETRHKGGADYLPFLSISKVIFKQSETPCNYLAEASKANAF